MLLISTDIMGYPLNEGGEFILDVDACDTGIGAVLMQIQDDRERVLAYGSRALNKAESNYCITEKELLAVRFFVEHYRQYLLGRRFRVRTDHQALTWLFRLKEPRGKIARWIEILSQYDFVIEYRQGSRQAHCDALSRCENPKDCDCMVWDTEEPLRCGPCKKCCKRAQDMVLQGLSEEEGIWFVKTDMENEVKVNGEGQSESKLGIVKTVTAGPSTTCSDGACNPDQIESDTASNSSPDDLTWVLVGAGEGAADMRVRQLEDSVISPVLQAKEKESRPTKEATELMSPASRHYCLLWDHLRVIDGVLVKEFNKADGTGKYGQVLIPEKAKADVLQSMHGGLLAGHMGTRKTKAKILQRFYWFNLREDVQRFVRQCDICARDKKPPKPPRAPLGTIRTGAPWDVLATDYLGPLPVTPRGNKYILVLTDHFSKYVEIIPVPDQTVQTCANRIVNEFIARWGCPITILSDQGRTYENNTFKQVCRMLEVKKLRTSVRNPRANGQVEKFNSTLIRMIKAYLKGEQADWDLNLGCLAGAYRATPHETTKVTPNLLTIGREVRLPAELVYGSVTNKQTVPVASYGEYADMIREKMNSAHTVARAHLHASAKRNKEIYDRRMLLNDYHEGDVVWCLAEKHQTGECPKLQPTYEGPCLVRQRFSPVNFLIQLNSRGSERVVHHNKLKPYQGLHTPSWIKKLKKSGK